MAASAIITGQWVIQGFAGAMTIGAKPEHLIVVHSNHRTPANHVVASIATIGGVYMIGGFTDAAGKVMATDTRLTVQTIVVNASA